MGRRVLGVWGGDLLVIWALSSFVRVRFVRRSASSVGFMVVGGLGGSVFGGAASPSAFTSENGTF